MARIGTIAAQREGEQEPVLVMSALGMSAGALITHCRERHAGRLQFITTNEHEARHRLDEEDESFRPNHIHANHIDDPPQPETQTIAKKPEARARTRQGR